MFVDGNFRLPNTVAFPIGKIPCKPCLTFNSINSAKKHKLLKESNVSPSDHRKTFLIYVILALSTRKFNIM